MKKLRDLRQSIFILGSLMPVVLPVEAENKAVTFFQELKQGLPQTVVFYGTSLTHSGSWTRTTQEWFEANYPGLVTCLNSGGPGQNSDWGVRHLADKVLVHQPDLVFVEFSYNDAHSKFQMPLERGGKNLEAIVSGIREKKPQCGVILQIMNPPWDAPGKPSATDRPQLEAFNGNYRHYAKEKSLPLIDHYTQWKELEKSDPEKFRKFIPDGSHPSAEAGRIVIWPSIRRWLEDQASRVK